MAEKPTITSHLVLVDVIGEKSVKQLRELLDSGKTVVVAIHGIVDPDRSSQSRWDGVSCEFAVMNPKVVIEVLEPKS